MSVITARQLAEELLKNPNDIICHTTDNFEQGNATIPLTSIYLSRFQGFIEKRRFRDAFDGCNYTSDVVSPNGKGKMFVKI